MTPRGIATLAGLVALVVLVYAGSCWLFPFRKCFLCKGLGRDERDDREVFRDCWWCKGTGRRLRFGRRAYNHAKRRRDLAR